MSKQASESKTTFTGKSPEVEVHVGTKFNNGEPSGAQDRLSGAPWTPLQNTDHNSDHGS